jgi:hypothetical protein
MKTLFLAFKNCPKFLTYTSIISICLFLCNIFWWMNIKPVFEIASKIGEIANILFSSIITGHIFYALVNQIKENKDRENIKSIVSRSIEEIGYQSRILFEEYVNVSKYVPKTFPLSRNEIKLILNELETFQSLPNVSYGFPIPTNFTWFQIAQTSRQKVKTEINNLFRFSSLLDAEFIVILQEIEYSKFFIMIDQLSIFGKDFKQFSIFNESYFEIQNLNIKLIKYCLREKLIIIDNPEKEDILKKMVTSGLNKSDMKE